MRERVGEAVAADKVDEAKLEEKGPNQKWVDDLHSLGQKRVQELADLSFVTQLDEHSRVRPSTEWLTFGAALATKGTARAFVLNKIGEDVAVVGKAALPLGIAWGVVGAGFLTYELSEYLENSRKLGPLEDRLRKTDPAYLNSSDSIANLPSDLFEKIVPGWMPGFRAVVDQGAGSLGSMYHSMRNIEVPNYKQQIFEESLSKRSLSTEQYIAWAKSETSSSTKTLLAHDAILGGMSGVGAFYSATKLGLGRTAGGALVLAGIAAGVGLSRLKIAADESTQLSNLYKARLLRENYLN